MDCSYRKEVDPVAQYNVAKQSQNKAAYASFLASLAYFDLSPIPQSPFGLQLIAILILILSTVILLFYIRKKNKR